MIMAWTPFMAPYSRLLRELHATLFTGPDHDVESIFWVLISVLLSVNPMEPSVNLNFRWNKKARAYIDDHEIEKDSIDDLRDSLLTWETTMLEYALDPKFHSLAPMLHEMGRQIKPEYAFIDKGLPRTSLHEAMRRILLRYILEMTDPIELNPDTESSKNQRQT